MHQEVCCHSLTSVASLCPNIMRAAATQAGGAAARGTGPDAPAPGATLADVLLTAAALGAPAARAEALLALCAAARGYGVALHGRWRRLVALVAAQGRAAPGSGAAPGCRVRAQCHIMYRAARMQPRGYHTDHERLLATRERPAAVSGPRAAAGDGCARPRLRAALAGTATRTGAAAQRARQALTQALLPVNPGAPPAQVHRQ